mmetsp:Transcript_21910/g.51674  ORF Transcript_21910/g.51674 Transcript_21910/m.51674 type:complete len:296 (-) Transcript_21910:503-1390(-)
MLLGSRIFPAIRPRMLFLSPAPAPSRTITGMLFVLARADDASCCMAWAMSFSLSSASVGLPFLLRRRKKPHPPPLGPSSLPPSSSLSFPSRFLVPSSICLMSTSGTPSSPCCASYVERKSSGMDVISSLSILRRGSSRIRLSICSGLKRGLARYGLGALTTLLLGHRTSSAIAPLSILSSSFRSQGICVISPPATVRSNPIRGGRGRLISMASHPGSSGRSPTSINRTGPSNLRFFILTGIFAPTRSSISANALDSHLNSMSNAMSLGPRSNSRASRRRGAMSPMLNFFSVALEI